MCYCLWSAIALTIQAMYVQRNILARSRNFCCSGEAIVTKYYEYVFVALVTQHALHMCRIVLSSVARPALQYFSTLLHKGTIFLGRGRGEVIEYKICILIFSPTFVRNISHSKKN